MPEKQQQTQPGVWIDPYGDFNFRIEIGGVEQGHFTDCTNVGAKIDAIRYREGGNAQVEHRIPGRLEYGDVTLRYGLTSSMELWDWFLAAVNGQVERRNITIVTLQADGVTEAMRWNLLNCWPSAFRGAPLDAMGNEIAIEAVTLVYEGLERMQPQSAGKAGDGEAGEEAAEA